MICLEDMENPSKKTSLAILDLTGLDELYGNNYTVPQQQQPQQKKYFIIVKLVSGEIVQKVYPTIDRAAQARVYYLTRKDIIDQVSRIGTL